MLPQTDGQLQPSCNHHAQTDDAAPPKTPNERRRNSGKARRASATTSQMRPNIPDCHATLQAACWLLLLLLPATLAEGATTAQQPMQRRFMWRGMETPHSSSHHQSMMEGLVDGVMSGARAMFGELLPASSATTAQTPSYAELHQATETTHIKYIIRNPHTNKPMKIIKMRPPKKVVKLMALSSTAGRHEHKVNGGGGGGGKKQSEASLRYPNAGLLRQMEREKEQLVAAAGSTGGDGISPDDDDGDVHSGTIYEFGGGWKPVASALQQDAPSPPMLPPKAYPMSELHTSIVGAPLQQNELNEHDDSDDAGHDAAGHDVAGHDGAAHDGAMASAEPHMYEVTEYTAEESVALPLTQDYRPLRGGFLPSARQPHFYAAETKRRPATTTTTAEPPPVTTTTTTTEEAPNYPAAYLKKYRERVVTPSLPLPPRPLKISAGGAAGFRASAVVAGGNSWLPSNHSALVSVAAHFPYSMPRAHQRPHKTATASPPFIPTTLPPLLPAAYHHAPLTTAVRVRSQKWPGGESPASSPPRPFISMGSGGGGGGGGGSIDPATEETRTNERRKGARLKEAAPNRVALSLSTSTSSAAAAAGMAGKGGANQAAVSRPRDPRQRGTVKFGDKINWE